MFTHIYIRHTRFSSLYSSQLDFKMGIIFVLFCVCIFIMCIYIYIHIYRTYTCAFSSVHSLSHVRLFETPWIAACQASLSITISWSSPKLSPSSRWCHPAISSSVVPFSSCLQSFLVSESFPMSLFFTSNGQSIAVSASASVLPMNIQHWFPLGWTGVIFLQSQGLSRVFSNTTQFKSINSLVFSLL